MAIESDTSNFEGGERTTMTIDERAKELRRKYLREWRAKNPDKMRKYAESYWARKAEKIEKELNNADNGENRA